MLEPLELGLLEMRTRVQELQPAQADVGDQTDKIRSALTHMCKRLHLSIYNDPANSMRN